MKNRILLSIGLICSFMGMNIQEGMGQIDNFNGSGCGAATTSGTCTVAIGEDADASGTRNIAIGYGAKARGLSSVAIGLDAQAGTVSTSNMGFALGFLSEALANESFTFGSTLQATAVQSMVIGIGTTPYLVNNIPQSLMIGMNSDVPSFFIGDGNNAYSNIGIATTDPLARMHINGTLRLGENAATTPTTGILEFENTTNANVFSITSGPSGSTFGWTLPATQGGADEVLTNNGSGALSWSDPDANAWTLTGNANADASSRLGATTTGVPLRIFAGNGTTERIFIDGSSGNVGIGTTTPDGLLHLNATNTYMIVEKGIDNEGGVVWHNGPQSAVTANASLMFETDETLRLRNAMINENVVINVNDGGTNREAIFVEGTSAHVGIGTSNPVTRLHVVALAATVIPDDETIARFAVSDNDTAFIQLENIDDTNGHFAGGIRSISSTADNSALLIVAAVDPTIDTGTEPMMIFSPRRLGSTSITTRPLFEWANNTNSKMLMKANGDLGIGTTTPSGKLHVVGTAFVNTLPAADETPVGWIATGTNQFQLVDNSGSSIHFKENVNELEFDHEAFLSLQPKRYNWKPALGGKPSVGFIAQEAGEVFPELADIRPKHTINDDGTLDYDSLGQAIVDTTQLEPYGFKYHKLPVYTFAIVKQLHADNLENRQRIDVLEQQLAQCCANPQLRQEQTGQMEPAKRIVPTIESIALTSSPNPFSEYSDIKSTIPQSAKSASLIIVNAQGAVVQHSTLSSGQSEVIRIYTSEIGVGLFTCYLLLDGDIAASCKIISTK